MNPLSPTSAIAMRVLEAAKAEGLMLATVESCTGGMIAAALTDIAGSSAAFERGFITYSNQSKSELVGVSEALIGQYGAVSAEVAKAMAEGALSHAPVDLAVSVTGIAGPDGGSAEKPVGLVYMAAARKGRETQTERHVFSPADRATVRELATMSALALLMRQI